MIFAQNDPPSGGVIAALVAGAVTLLGLLGAGIRWLMGWFRDQTSSQQEHEKALALSMNEHEKKLVATTNEHQKETIKDVDALFLRYDATATRFDTTVRELHQSQAKEAAQTISVLLAIQKDMLSAVLTLRQQSEKVEALIIELRNQVERNGVEMRNYLKTIPLVKSDRVRKGEQP